MTTGSKSGPITSSIGAKEQDHEGSEFIAVSGNATMPIPSSKKVINGDKSNDHERSKKLQSDNFVD